MLYLTALIVVNNDYILELNPKNGNHDKQIPMSNVLLFSISRKIFDLF